VLSHEPGAGAPKQSSEHERHEDGVVELARDRDEVGNQVERHGEVHQREPGGELPARRDTPVGEQPLEQDGAMGHEPGDHANVPSASADVERADQRRVDDEENDSGEDDPAHPAPHPKG
jgi:hypothetical protein